MKHLSKKEIFTIPNMIGYLRILLIPLFCTVYLRAETDSGFYWAAGIVLFSSFTDLFDGMIARKCNQVTELGKFLDPLADKLTHGAMALCLAFRYPLMWALLALMAVKEGYMALMGLKFLKYGKKLDGAKWFGKVCTAVLFAGMAVLFFWVRMPVPLANTLIGIMMAVMAFTLGSYIPVFRDMARQLPR